MDIEVVTPLFPPQEVVVLTGPTFLVILVLTLPIVKFLKLVPGQGFEPQLTESESAVLPVKLTRNMDRGQGLEPRQSDSKSDVLPLNYPRKIQVLSSCLPLSSKRSTSNKTWWLPGFFVKIPTSDMFVA